MHPMDQKSLLRLGQAARRYRPDRTLGRDGGGKGDCPLLTDARRCQTPPQAAPAPRAKTLPQRSSPTWRQTLCSLAPGGPYNGDIPNTLPGYACDPKTQCCYCPPPGGQTPSWAGPSYVVGSPHNTGHRDCSFQLPRGESKGQRRKEFAHSRHWDPAEPISTHALELELSVK